MKITYIAHASFLIQTISNVRILTDPYDSSVGYKVFEIEADAVTTSHKHFDHAYTDCVKTNFVLVDKPKEYDIKGVKIVGIKAFHDNEKGKKRGENIIFVIEDQLRVVHLGDLGHELDDELVKKIGEVDILLIPVGGTFTIDANSAVKVVKALNPKIIIPMHYKTDKLRFDLGPVDEFTRHFDNVEKVNSYEINIDKLPEVQKVVLLNHKG